MRRIKGSYPRYPRVCALNWRGAQHFVKSLIIERLGPPPPYFKANMGVLHAYQKKYMTERTRIQQEDYPINP